MDNKSSTSKSGSFSEILETQIRPNLFKADQSAEFAAPIIRSLIANKELPSPDQLKQLCGVCLPIGFTIGQHISAVERLENYLDWQQTNKDLWQSIREGRTLIGLGTTHLASHNKHMLHGKLDGDDIIVNGSIPWATGRRLYDKLIFGFRTDKELVFAMINFPKEDTTNLKMTPHKLAVFNSTDSVRIELKDFKVKKEWILSRRPDGAPANVKPFRYWRPEIGIASECLNKVDQWLKNSQHPKAIIVKEKSDELKNKIKEIETIEESLSPDRDKPDVVFKIENVIHASLRLLILAKGSSIFQTNSEVLLLQNQLNLMDVWIQNPDLINLKIRSL